VPVTDAEVDCCPYLKGMGLTLSDTTIYHNAPAAMLYEEAMHHEPGTYITAPGALATRSGQITGRCPADKRIVVDPHTEKDVWWGSTNIKTDRYTFLCNRARAIDYLNTRKTIFVVDGFSCWDERYRMKVRVVTTRAYQALFMQNMLVRASAQELQEFGVPDCFVYSAGDFLANVDEGNSSAVAVTISLETNEIVVLGTQYAGELKKAIFTVMQYRLPKAGVLSMHSAANEGDDGSVTLFCGLSGTGKTSLSTDPLRKLIGDDEHAWTDRGIVNIEAGCYAKCFGLSRKEEPEIWEAIKFGTVLENVVIDESSRLTEYGNRSITENTRAAYPITFVPNAKVPCMGAHPNHIIFLICDAFGVLPPVARLTVPQAVYHFLSGYTAKVAGTEQDVEKPVATFSSCFGQPFLVWHPTKYALMFQERLVQHNATCWMVNTGWTGGSFGVGQRMRIATSRAIITAIQSGSLKGVEYELFDVFNLMVPTVCPGVHSALLYPGRCWSDFGQFQVQLQSLAQMFQKNFEQFASLVPPEVLQAGPKL
jgi:phosphoenolpyruvate carboxykinase (ATP)